MKRILIMFAACYLAVATYAQEIIDYGITVNGIAVTSENSDNIIGNFIKGTIRYDADSNTLTLQDASFFEISSSRTDCLNINVTGTNLMTTYYSDLHSISCSGDLHITGTGRLISSIVNVAESLTISGNCFIEAFRIIANALTIDKSILQANSVQAEDIELIGCKQAFDNPFILYCPENDTPQFYGLCFANSPITTYNADNITNAYILSGNASYDSRTNTLSLKNIIIDDERAGGYFIIIECSNDILNIHLNGNNMLRGTMQGKNVNVSGDGFMEIYTIEGNPFWISSLVLEGGCEFATSSGAQTGDIEINSLTVNNSTFRFLFGEGDLYIYSLNLINAAIEDNPSIIYDSETGLFSNNSYSYPELVIKPTCSSSIKDISTVNHNAKLYYDMQGRRIAEPTAPGIYIKGGKKVVVK